MRILVTGSRNWEDEGSIRKALLSYADPHPSSQKEPVTLIEGGAQGADRLARRVATDMGWTVETHEAEWNFYGKRAGYIRNAQMVASGAEVCFAFILNESKGATMCAKLADKAGIPVLRYVA